MMYIVYYVSRKSTEFFASSLTGYSIKSNKFWFKVSIVIVKSEDVLQAGSAGILDIKIRDLSMYTVSGTFAQS